MYTSPSRTKSPPCCADIFHFNVFRRLKNEINKNRSPFPIEWQGVFVISLAQHGSAVIPVKSSMDSIPGNDPAFCINNKGCIRQEVDDI